MPIRRLQERPRTAEGFEHFYNLEYDQALTDFRSCLPTDPANPNYQNHLAQAVLYREMFRGGALESELVSGRNPFIRREKLGFEQRGAEGIRLRDQEGMEIANARIAKNPERCAGALRLGVSHGLRANYNFLVRKAWMDSLKDATSARKAHNRVVELDPDLSTLGWCRVFTITSSAVSLSLKILGFIAGFHGDRESGMKALQLVADKGNPNRYDAKVLLAVIYRREKKPDRLFRC